MSLFKRKLKKKGLIVMENNTQKEVLLKIGGPFSDFFKKLAGEEAVEWHEAFKKFLRKENPWFATRVVKQKEKGAERQLLARSIENWVDTNGYILCTRDGFFFEPKQEYTTKISEIGFSYPITINKHFLFIPYKKRKFVFLGYLDFEENNWEFFSHGEEYEQKVHELCDKLGKKFERKITIFLQNIYPRFVEHRYKSIDSTS